MDLKSLRYTESHEWVLQEGDVCTVGITQFAADQLTDITYIELPDVGKKVTAQGTFGVIESVKSANDLYSPVAGEVVAVNTKLPTDTSVINSDPYGKGWMIKVKVAAGATLDHMMTLEQYQKQIAEGGH
jgi:glycine cleavage system H protein